VTEHEDAGAVDTDRVGAPSSRRRADNQTDGEPRAGGSNDVLTVETGRRLTLRADPPGVPSITTPLVARDRELAVLNAALQATQVDGRAVVIGGDAGSGKSALLAAFLADARSGGVAVVEGSCVEIESQRPFGVFADVLASCERAFGSERIARSLSERGVSVKQLISPGATDPGVGRDRYQVHGAILGLLGELTSDGPLAVFIEDLHWADAASLELFGYLTRRLRARPVLIVASYRTDELDRRHPLRPALAELRKSRLIEELPLPTLDIEGTGGLIHAWLGLRDAAPLDLREFRELVHARCEGNPLHTEETLDTLRQRGHLRYADGAWSCDVVGIRSALPASVADGVVARWAALTPAAQQVLLVASVAGHRFDIELVASVSGFSIDALAPLIHEAIDARLVSEETTDQPLTFRHALTREALRQQLLQSERVALHAKIAAFLERRGAASVRPAELAYHLEESGDPAKASRHHEAAAREAAASTDYGSAARSMERAIATASDGDTEQARRQMALVGYLRRSGDDPRASRAATTALEIGERNRDARLQGRALVALYQIGYRNSDQLPGQQPLDRALTLLEPLGPTKELAHVYWHMAGAASRRGDGVAAAALAERARQIATELELPTELMMATLNVGVGLYVQGRQAEGIAATREAVELAQRADLIEELYNALMTLSVQLVSSGASSDEQRDLQMRMRALARAHGLADQGWIVRELRWRHGEADWDGFLKLLPQVPEPERSDFDVPRLLTVLTAVARSGPSELDGAGVAGMPIAYRNSAPTATWSAMLLLIAERPAEAVALAAATRDEDVKGTFWGLVPASLVHAVGLFAARECGDLAARDRFVDSLLVERPIPVSANYNRRHVALAQADIAERAGRIEDALAAYSVALAECERGQFNDPSAVYFMSLIWQRRAELFLRVTPPDVVAAQAEFDALLPYWQKAKATWYLGRLRTWAEERGLAFPHSDKASEPSTASGQLTRRELEVARLVAQGLTNREIGTRLTLSVRTAESHVEQIRAKLGFKTRAQIASWVTERYGARTS
jgi:DNA-binding CsgD family transcriptional regulator/tetratricopeptide (TPR) repeat protein